MELSFLVSEQGIFLVMGIILTIIILTSNNKASKSTLRKMFAEYENLINDYNNVVENIGSIKEAICNKVFKEIKDKNNAVEIINKTNVGFTSFLEYNDKIVFYLQKGNVRQYRKYFKKANTILEELNKGYDELCDYESNMQTVEEFERIKREEFERQQEEKEMYERGIEQPTIITFFVGCNTKEEIEKRYKSLCKVYHPDTSTGNTETFQKMNEEYNLVLRQLEDLEL